MGESSRYDIRRNVQIEFPRERFTTSVEVKVLDGDTYELLEHPGFAEANYGDVISAVEMQPGHLQFRRVIRKSPLTMAAYGLSSRVNVESQELSDILEKVMQTGGFWQCDLGGLLWVFFDPGRFDPRGQIDAIQGVSPHCGEEMTGW
jgi:hypothetical protein